eukprot:3603237-Pleurochrysis_carterae.AAC.1
MFAAISNQKACTVLASDALTHMRSCTTVLVANQTIAKQRILVDVAFRKGTWLVANLGMPSLLREFTPEKRLLICIARDDGMTRTSVRACAYTLPLAHITHRTFGVLRSTAACAAGLLWRCPCVG